MKKPFSDLKHLQPDTSVTNRFHCYSIVVVIKFTFLAAFAATFIQYLLLFLSKNSKTRVRTHGIVIVK